MIQSQNFKIREDSDLKIIIEFILKNYRLFILSISLALSIVFLINRYSIPVYNVSSSILIKEAKTQQSNSNVNDFLNSNLLGRNQNFQNELWTMKSPPVLEQTIRNLDLSVSYYLREKYLFHDAYMDAPFRVFILKNHPQPVNLRFEITFTGEGNFQLKATSRKTTFFNFETEQVMYRKDSWSFVKNGNFGELIETDDLAFIIKPDSTSKEIERNSRKYGFEFKTIATLSNEIEKKLKFNFVDKQATVIEMNLKSESLQKGIDLLNELMNVYSEQNLQRKNHLATVTIDYIDKQLNEISDSLSQTEDNLQKFRSSNQLLNITDQATGISAQYLDLQNQLAELVARKRYYDYVSDYLLKNDNFSNMIVPSSIGIQDPLLSNLMSELIAAQAQRSNLIENNQEKNPLIQKLNIQIENVKKTISDNIEAISKTTSISIDEMNKRIIKIESEIQRLPSTQRRLGTIERKYRLNDVIYNYLLEKRAEAKITKASNLPDDIIIGPPKMVGSKPIFPRKHLNFMAALLIGLAFPFGLGYIKSILNDKIQDDIENHTDEPIIGKIMHSDYKTKNVMLEFPTSSIAESFRSLRTKLNFYIRVGHYKVIMVTSCLERDGKTFVALNLATSYAQLGRRTIIVNFDLRKPETYFNEQEKSQEGLSSFLIDKINLEDIIIKSPHENLDYINSGILPPNPVELIAMDKTEKLLSRLKEDYDIIVLDTTPLAQVTDAYLLMEHADLKIVAVRQNATLKKVFSLIMKDLKLTKVSNVCIVLNDNKYQLDQYGYGYGYNSKQISGKAMKNWKKRFTYYSTVKN